MAKIKTDIVITRRSFSEKTDKSVTSQLDDEDIERRSGAPSPDTRPQETQPSPRRRVADEKENEPELPSYAASVESPGVLFSPDKIASPAYGKISRAEISHTQNMNTFAFPIVVPQQQDVFDGVATDRVRSPNPTFLAPPSAVFSNARTNSDLNRFVSSSTTATNATGTTLTGGSFVKHPGPPQMVRITPTDLPGLPDRVGKMVYDSALKRWVKEKGLPPQNDNKNVDATTGEVEGESDDPFRDFESLRDEDSRNHNATLDASNITGFSQGYVSAHSEEMQMDDSDSDTDEDDDEAHFSTFSFTGPAAGVVHVITGEEDMDEEDETTDTDGEPLPEQDDGGNSDYEEMDSGNNLSSHIASLASMSISDSPAKQPGTNGHNIAVFTSVDLAMQTPSAQEKRVVQPPRSVLKSASVTPANKPGHRRSVSFSDGRTDGKILDTESADRRSATSFLPSTRTNRIADMLGKLEDESEQE